MSALTYEPRTIGTNDYVNLGFNEQGQDLGDLMPPYLDWDNERKQVYDITTGEDFVGNDWRDIVYEDWQLQTQHNLSARGRSEDIGYFISVGFTDTESQLRKVIREVIKENMLNEMLDPHGHSYDFGALKAASGHAQSMKNIMLQSLEGKSESESLDLIRKALNAIERKGRSLRENYTLDLKQTKQLTNFKI